MTVQLQFQQTGAVPDRSGPIRMQGQNLTIGRGDTNDVVLPDPDGMISRQHCVLEMKGSSVVVIDLSSNGTFLNYSKAPLGKREVTLNDGDILTIGSYELVVEIRSPEADPMASIAPPVEDRPIMPASGGRIDDIASPLDGRGDGGGFLDDILGGPTKDGTANKLFPEQEGGILDPLPDEGDEFFARPSSNATSGQGASYGQSLAPTEGHFSPPRSGPSMIPDDFDDDFSKPEPKQPAPAPAPPPRPAPQVGADGIPEPLADPEPEPPVAKPTPARPQPAAPPAQDIPPDPFDEDPVTVPPKRAAPVAEEAAPQPATQAAPPPEAPAPAPAPAAPSGPPNRAHADAFLTALGLDPKDFSDEDLGEAMERLGGISKAMILGLRELLMTRSSIKAEFTLERTMIKREGNNPLKFSINEEQALEAISKPVQTGYLDGVTAIEEALKDIRAHEIGMVTGMQAALEGVLAKLDPKQLEDKISGKGGLGSMFKGQKARYWEAYEAMYKEISEQATEDFHELFGKEFARAYQEQLKKL